MLETEINGRFYNFNAQSKVDIQASGPCNVYFLSSKPFSLSFYLLGRLFTHEEIPVHFFALGGHDCSVLTLCFFQTCKIISTA